VTRRHGRCQRPYRGLQVALEEAAGAVEIAHRPHRLEHRAEAVRRARGKTFSATVDSPKLFDLGDATMLSGSDAMRFSYSARNARAGALYDRAE
jgi:hypothetical protein